MASLNALKIKTNLKPGKYADGGGLYLYVRPNGRRGWVFRYMLRGARREMGLGSIDLVGLAQAREIASGCRQLLADGKDPIQNRIDAQATATSQVTFGECLNRFIEAHAPSWTNARQRGIWENSFENHAASLLRIPIAEVSQSDVIQVLGPIWGELSDTAGRLQNRIERVLDYGRAMGLRTGDNPASWRNNLRYLLPAPPRGPVKHYEAMPSKDVPNFFARLGEGEGFSYRAFELLILTVTRTSETLKAEWSEFDFVNGIWTIPAERMKARRAHRVPLSAQAIELLRRLPKVDGSDFVFPSVKRGVCLSNMALLAIMRRFETDVVPHGFRSTFKDWATEFTEYSNEVSEMALAHVVSNKVEAAYRRGDLLEKRRALMQDWADFVSGVTQRS